MHCHACLLADDILGSLRATGNIGPGDVVGGHCMHPACLQVSKYFLRQSKERRSA